MSYYNPEFNRTSGWTEIKEGDKVKSLSSYGVKPGEIYTVRMKKEYSWMRDATVPIIGKGNTSTCYWVFIRRGYTLEQLIKKTYMDIKKAFKNLFTSQEQKDLNRAGVTNDCGELTSDGAQIVVAWLFNKHKTEFKKDVVDPILAEQDKQKKKE